VNRDKPGPSYPPGTVVTLTAVPDSGSDFISWFGDCSGSGDCVLTMNSDHFVTAEFDLSTADAGVCGVQQVAGGPAADTREIEMGRTSGNFDFSYETFSIEDQMTVSYQGLPLLDTGCVGTNGTVTRPLSFGPGSSTKITVSVSPNCNPATAGSTAWNYTVGCPQ